MSNVFPSVQKATGVELDKAGELSWAMLAVWMTQRRKNTPEWPPILLRWSALRPNNVLYCPLLLFFHSCRLFLCISPLFAALSICLLPDVLVCPFVWLSTYFLVYCFGFCCRIGFTIQHGIWSWWARDELPWWKERNGEVPSRRTNGLEVVPLHPRRDSEMATVSLLAIPRLHCLLFQSLLYKTVLHGSREIIWIFSSVVPVPFASADSVSPLFSWHPSSPILALSLALL